MIKVYDELLHLVLVVDNYNSFSYTTDFTQSKAFKLKLPFVEDFAKHIKPNCFLLYNGYMGVVQTMEISSQSGIESILVAGYDLKSLLGRRMIKDTVTFSGNTETFLRKVVNENCIVTEENRIIPFMQLGKTTGISTQLHLQVSYQNLLDTLSSVCAESGIGFDVVFDEIAKQFYFTALMPKQTTKVFSYEFENVMSQFWLRSNCEYANVAYVAGEGDGEQRKKVTVGGSAGLNRFEIFVDAREIQSSDGITEQQYLNLLAYKGDEQLSLRRFVDSFECDVIADDLAVGEVVTLQSKDWGITAKAMVSRIETVIEHTGTTKVAYFGDTIRL
ncbi:MAG: siphovirus ReqiPepy6 Gp37-like family protein [Christensenellaceae bacterium]